MSEPAALWIFGILIGALFALIGFLAKIFWAKLNELDSGALAAFVARFDATERSWENWRVTYTGDTEKRRAEIDKRLDAHADHFRGVETRMQAMENRVTRIDRNGH